MTPEQLRVVGEVRALALKGEAKTLREARQIGLRELARVIPASPSTLSRWENGITKPRAERALRWAAALGLTPENDNAPGVQPGAHVEHVNQPIAR